METKSDMRKAVLLFTILFFCMINSPAQERVEQEEYEIYKAWLNKSFVTPETKQIFIFTFTAGDFHNFTDLSRKKRQQLSQLQSSTLKNYTSRNRKPLKLENNFGVIPVISLSSEEELPDFFINDSDYIGFAEKFGAEYRISFSRVGFNKKKNQALIHVHYKSNSIPKYAFGYYFLLLKEADDWIVKNRVKSWEF